MEDYQKRVIDEQADLASKIKSLKNFLYGLKLDELEVQDHELLEIQLSVMQSYSKILCLRIQNFK